MQQTTTIHDFIDASVTCVGNLSQLKPTFQISFNASKFVQPIYQSNKCILPSFYQSFNQPKIKIIESCYDTSLSRLVFQDLKSAFSEHKALRDNNNPRCAMNLAIPSQKHVPS